MSHPFDAIRPKLQRAEENLGKLGREIDALAAEHYRVTKEQYYKGKGEYGVGVLIETTATEAELARISVLVGEIVYQLRSSLDHAFWKLIDGDPLTFDKFRSFSFPVAKSEAQYNSDRGRKKWRLVGNAEAIVEGLQPYKRGDEYWKDPLWILNELSVIDRHRLLATSMLAADLPSSDPRSRYLQPFHHDTPLSYSWDPTKPVDVKSAVMLSVELGKDWPRFEQPLPKILEYLIGATNEVLSALAKVFGPDDVFPLTLPPMLS